MATGQDQGRRFSLVVEVIVAPEAQTWCSPQVSPVTRPGGSRPRLTHRPRVATSECHPTAGGNVVVAQEFGTIEDVSVEAVARPPCSKAPAVPLLCLAILSALVLLSGMGVVELPETVRAECGLGLSALAVFTGVHALMHR